MTTVHRALRSVPILAIWLAVNALRPALCTASEPGKAERGPVVAEVDFERHVASLLTRLGCNAAACHGAFDGKGDFRLSLFGQSAAQDYAAIQDGRIDLETPNDSMLLRKPAGFEEHGGGVRLPPDSWEYDLIRRWIADGARQQPGRGMVRELHFDPREAQLEIGKSATLRIRASFLEGGEEDVTPFVAFRSQDETVAEFDKKNHGELVAHASGEVSITASYRGVFAAATVIVPYLSTTQASQELTNANVLDVEVTAHLNRLRLASSPIATDEEFLRRATLDVIGILPSPEEIRHFVEDSDPNKRGRKIDALLAHPRRAALWATRMCDMTACNVAVMEQPESLRPKWAKMWHDWFRRRFEINVPYDEIVRGVLVATSRNEQSVDTWIEQEIAHRRIAEAGFDSDYASRPTLDLFWRRTGADGPLPVEDLAELVASAFLGLKMHCARCHQHPYDRWSQADFAGYANVFARTEFGSSTGLRTAMNERLKARRRQRQSGEPLAEIPRLQEVFLAARNRPLADAKAFAAAPTKAPGGPLIRSPSDPRQDFFQWLRQPDNPFFARNFVNRVWAKYFGSGFVEPVDAFSAGNPPKYSRLLDRLTHEFVRCDYDVVQLERMILTSRTYQRSTLPVGNNTSTKDTLARASIRPMLAEVLVDSLNAALETNDHFGSDVPRGSQAIELAPNQFSEPAINELFRILGRGDRKSLCDCDRNSAPTIRLPTFLMSDSRVLDKIRNGRLARLLKENQSDAQITDEFYLATLSRLPDSAERDVVIEHMAMSDDRASAWTDIVWALINTREFITNH